MKILKLLSICLFIYTNISYAQYSISGTVTDAQKEALPFANIILYEKGKEATPKGVVSDDNGAYSFNNLKKGTYKIEVSMLGFTKETIQFFDLTSNKTFNLILKEQNQSLDEVVVKSKRPVIKQTAEKLVLNLENSELLSNNLQDVVKSIPGVIVTNNGISFAGRSDIRILINGKTTDYMDTDALLRDLPADNIAKVEFIEQPGAEFDAEGAGPIINIILKKNVRIGMHGNVGVWVGEDEGFEYGTSASIANYKNKLNWQLNAGYSSPTWRNDLFIEREVQETTYDQATREPYSPKNIWTGGSLDYYLNDKISVGFNTRYRNTVSDRIATARTTVTTPTTIENIFSDNTFERDRNTFNLNPYFEYKTEKDKFIVDFNYIDFQDGNMNTIYPVAGNTNDFAEQRYFQNGEFTIKTTKVDYTKNLSDKVKLSVGSKYSDVDTDSDLKLFVANNVGDFEFQSGGSNRFLIDENIFAVYSKINATLGKWSFSGGLRYENSDTKGTSTTTNETRDRKISQLFPSFSVSRKLTEQLGANFAYSYRIRRPNYNSLNSFVTLYDPLTSEVGNPSLNPAFTNNYQFNLTFDSQPFFTVGYSDTKDNLFLFISQDDATAQISRTTINLQDRENWNFRFFGPLDFIEGLEGFSGITVNYNNFRSNELNPVLELSKWSYGWYTQASYKLPWNINAEMSSYLGSGILEGQIDSGWIGDLSFSFGKKFMDDRLKVNLGIYKVLDRGFVGRVNYDNINANIESNGSRQNVQLRLTYSFGSRFGKKKEKRNSSRDEENRIQDND